MSEFIKAGGRIIPKPNGLDCDLVTEKVYNLMYDKWNHASYFEEDGSLSIPKKVYSTDDDTMFVKRVINYHNNTDKLSTGVMLSGIKGTGKTVMAKVIARDSKLPVIVVNEEYPTSQINDFFKKFTTPVCVIFDEVDKYWNTESLLGWLDGVQTNAKKLVLFTCNDDQVVTTYLKDRCSRVRYLRKFAADENTKFLKSIIKDKGIDDVNNELYKFIVDSFNLLSMDNILSFLDEKLLFPELSNFALVKDMNIMLKKDFKLNENNDAKESSDDKYYENAEDNYDNDEYYDEDDDDDKCEGCNNDCYYCGDEEMDAVLSELKNVLHSN